MTDEMNKFCNDRGEGLGLCLRVLGAHGRAVSKSGETGSSLGAAACGLLTGGRIWELMGLSQGWGCGDREETRQNNNKEVMFEILHSEEEHSRLLGEGIAFRDWGGIWFGGFGKI